MKPSFGLCIGLALLIQQLCLLQLYPRQYAFATFLKSVSEVPRISRTNTSPSVSKLFQMFRAFETIHFYIFNSSIHKYYYVGFNVLLTLVVIYWRTTPLTDYTALYLRRYNSSQIILAPRTSLHQPSIITHFLYFDFQF
jgi:hypothetical protein